MEWINQLLGGLALAIGTWLGTRIIKPKDHERAQLLATIAASAAALVVSLNPTATWAQLVKLTVNQIAGAAGVPTNNAAAIERAAAAALTSLGKKP